MSRKKLGKNTICTHVGEVPDEQFKGSVSPIYMGSSYEFLNVDVKRYPRYFNTPNQEYLAKKIARLEHAEAAMIFTSGMAAVSTTLLAFLSAGDHIVLQNDIYGGTRNLIEDQFERFNIEYSFTNGLHVDDFKACIKPNTKLIYLETPSNPLLRLVDIEAVANLSKTNNLLSVIDNTFATPIIQKPIDFGVDIVLHSATKYFGGHSDISAGAVATKQEHIDTIWNLAKNLGGNLSDFMVWMLERSMKTLSIRVKAQQKNAKKIAKILNKNNDISKVYYPGLKSHPDHKLAKKQMKGFGAMLSFELVDGLSVEGFLNALTLIKPSMSLAGVESTMILPALTAHALLSPEDRASQGIKDGLIRFSVGLEEVDDLMDDIQAALTQVKKQQLTTSNS